MKTTLALCLLVLKGSIAAQIPTGVVTGMVRSGSGQAQAGVRVAAMAAGGNPQTDVLVSIGRTDEDGIYLLQVPPGRYYIVAGRVDTPWFYPGVATREDAAIISIAAGVTTDGLDFVVSAVSGVVRDTTGRLQTGTRVTAVDASSSYAGANCESALIASTETDDKGQYRLDIFPGRYYILAGRLNLTTYYPAATSRQDARAVFVGSRQVADELNVTLPNESLASSNSSREGDLYGRAVENYRIGCDIVARLLFQTLISTYPQSSMLPEAKYAFAESFYRDGTQAGLAQAQRLFAEYLVLFPNATQLPKVRQILADIHLKSSPSSSR